MSLLSKWERYWFLIKSIKIIRMSYDRLCISRQCQIINFKMWARILNVEWLLQKALSGTDIVDWLLQKSDLAATLSIWSLDKAGQGPTLLIDRSLCWWSMPSSACFHWFVIWFLQSEAVTVESHTLSIAQLIGFDSLVHSPPSDYRRTSPESTKLWWPVY